MRPIFYFILVFLLGLGFVYRISTSQTQKIPRNQAVKIAATVKAEPRISGGLQVLEIGDSKVYVDLYPRYRVGDRIKVSGEVDSEGRIFRPQIEVAGHQDSLSSFFSNIRLNISQNIASYLPSREATIVSGTVLGVDTIERDFRDQLIKTGTIHVVVVSGQNLMIVAGVFLSLVRYIGRRKSLALACLAVVTYAFLTGFEPPVVRASIMVILASGAIYFGRQVMPVWSLVLAALLIIFIWPRAVFEVSFQLTFAATLGIMTLGQKIQLSVLGFQLSDEGQSVSQLTGQQKTGKLNSENRQRKTDNRKADMSGIIKDMFLQNAAIATSAYIFTAPIILFYFGRISPLAPLANILVAEAVFPVMILGFLVSIISLIFSPLAQVISYIAYVPAYYFVKVVEVFAKIPVEQVSLGKGNAVVVFGFYVFLIVLMLVWMRKSKNSNF